MLYFLHPKKVFWTRFSIGNSVRSRRRPCKTEWLISQWNMASYVCALPRAPCKEVWEEVCLFLIFFHFTLSFLQGRSTVLWRPSDGVFLRKVLFVFSFVQFFLTWSKVFRWGFICGQGVAIRFGAQGCSYSVGRESGPGKNIVCVQGKRLTFWKFPGMSVSQRCHAS